MIPLSFEVPSVAQCAAFADWLEDWNGDPYDPYRGIFVRAWTDCDWYVDLCERMRTAAYRPVFTVPLDARWAFWDRVLVGELYLFYEPMGGDNHIGYKVRPSYRRRGIASALLRHGLERIRERGITTASLTCLDANIASATVIERAGGVRLDDKTGLEAD